MTYRRLHSRIPAGVALAGAAALVALVLPTGAAWAGAPSVSVSPATGTSGAVVSISGSGWPGDDVVRIDLVQGSASTFMCTVGADSTGAFAGQTCTVPTSVPHGAYTVTASDASLTATTALTVDPGATVLGFDGAAASTVAAGQSVGLSGSGFAPSSGLSATIDGKAAALTVPATTTAVGQFSGTGIVVPAATTGGEHVVVVQDAAGHAATDHVLVAAATLAVAPSPGTSGAAISLSGSGYPSNDPVHVELNQGTSQNFVCASTTDGNGTLALSCAVPTFLPQGVYSLVVEDGSLAVTRAFTLDPGVTVTGFLGAPTSTAAAGQAVGLGGSGFAPASALKATLDGASVKLTVATSTTTTGQFSGTGIVIPAATAAGSHALAVRDAAGHTATAHLQVYAATLVVSPSKGVSGASVALSGKGYPSNDPVHVELNQGASQNFVCASATDGNGTLALSCAVPTFLPQGAYSLVVEDGSLAVTSPFTLDPGVTVLGFDAAAAGPVAAGQVVGLTGSGFAPVSAVKATFAGATAKLTVATSTTTSGQFSGTGIVVPAATAAGSYPIAVKDAAGHTATVHVQVWAATLAVAPASGTSGSTLTVTGTGYPSNDPVHVELNQGASQNFVCASTTDGNGTLAQSCAVPTFLPQGAYTLVVEDGSLAVTKAFTLDPGIAITAANGQPLTSAAPGTPADLAGSGFTANSAIVKVTVGSTKVTVTPSPFAGPSGSFSGGAFTVPSLAAGVYTVQATDASGRSGTARLTVT